jgi:hypothetical protein
VRAKDIADGRCYVLRGGKTVRVASITRDHFGLLTVFVEQPEKNRVLSLAGFLLVAVKEVPCP